MTERCYLVTGGAGHLGNNLVRMLLDGGKTVRVLALQSEDISALRGLNVEIIFGDVRDRESMRPLFENRDTKELVLIHAAGIVSIASKFQQRVWDVNVEGTRNVLSLCREYHVSKLVHVSSVHAITELSDGRTITEISDFENVPVVGLYARTKAAATALVLKEAANGLCACVVHPSGIIGPRDFGKGHLTQLVKDYLDGRLTSAVDGGYDFVDVRDVCAGIIGAVEQGRSGECYILSNCYLTVRELLILLHHITGRREIKTYLPLWFAKATAPLAEAYYKILRQPPLYTAYSLYTLQSNANFSHEKAALELGYLPRPILETLTDTVNWLQETKRVKNRRLIKIKHLPSQ